MNPIIVLLSVLLLLSLSSLAVLLVKYYRKNEISDPMQLPELTNLQNDLKDALAKANDALNLNRIAIHSLEDILNSVDAMVYVTVPETGEIIFVNDYMKEVFEKSGEDLIGQYCYKLFRGTDDLCDFCPCYRLKDDPEAVIIWEEYVLGRNIRHSDCLIDWTDGKKVHLQHAVDITELVVSRELAEQANRAKGIFLAHMSHEIRTPLNAILGMSEIQLQKKDSSADVKAAFGMVYNSGNLLLKIIDDILDFSKIEAGKLEMNPQVYEIPSLISDTVQLIRFRYQSQAITFKLVMAENLLFELIGDEYRIKQILNNLLSNAFKYTAAGEVELSVATEPTQGENANLILCVRDTGQGMTEEQVATIFDDYTRFNMQMNQGISGTGLGMSITKRLIDMMDGEIVIESIVDKGTTFTVRLPQKISSLAICEKDILHALQKFDADDSLVLENNQLEYEHMPAGKVLVADDLSTNLVVAKGLLLPYGLTIDTVLSGYEVIEKIKSGNHYDVIFMDHMMPKMSGIEATKIIREMGYTQPIVAMTANAVVGQEEMFLANGFDGFISKPIDIRKLDVLLKNFIKNEPSDEEARAKAQKEDGQKNKSGVQRSELEKYFIADAKKAINVIQDIYQRREQLTVDDILSLVVTAHGMKSALAAIGELELSAFAGQLEKDGKEATPSSFTDFLDKIPAFVRDIEKLTEQIVSA